VLASLPGVPRGTIEAEVLQGHLVLRGRADSDEQARVIAAATGSVRGVANVDSQLRVAPGEASASRER
jgi:osmotically-inducible protein OsmY